VLQLTYDSIWPSSWYR